MSTIENKTLKGFLAFLLSLALYSSTLYAQCQTDIFSYAEGEELNYDVYYNWGFIWLNAGFVRFSVKPKVFEGKNVFHFDSYGASYKSYDWIFKVRDSYQAYLDKETLQPLWFHRQNSEGGYEVNNKYFFDWDNSRAITFTENSDRPFKQDTISIPDCTFDVLSVIYFCRNLDFSNLNINDTIPVVSIIDNEVHELYIRYLGEESIKDRNEREFNCIKFSALLVGGTIFMGGEDLFVWVTDDLNRVPILVEAKIRVGSVKAYFQSAEGLKNNMEAKTN